MASIVIKSSKFASEKIVLNDQSVTEDSAGLVSVNIKYTTTLSNRDYIASKFYLDSPPPVWPSAVNKYDLQTQNLYLVSRDVSQKAGLVEISAQYVGALNRALTKPNVSLQKESKAISFAAYFGTRALSWSSSVLGVRVDSTGPAFDSYSAQVISGVMEYSIAVAGNSAYVVSEPPKKDLILGASFTSVTLYNPTDSPFFDGPVYDRNLPPVDIVDKFANFILSSDKSNNFYTPTVSIQKIRFYLTIPQ